MKTKSHRIVLALASWALAASVLAQDAASGTDKERLQRAKKEQAEAQAAADATAKAESKAAADKAEEARLAKMGASDADAPVEEKKGFFVGLDAFSVSPEGADRDIARVGTIVTTATSAETLDTDVAGSGTPGEGLPDAYTMADQRMLRLTYDTQFSPVLQVGYRRQGGGAFSLRYQGWSADAALSAGAKSPFLAADPSQGDIILGNIDNQGLEATPANIAADPGAFGRPFGSPRQITGAGLHGADSVTARGTLELSRFDFAYSRTGLAKKRLELIYSVGLSYLDIRREESAQFIWHSFDRSRVALNASSTEDVSARCETTALGPMASIAARFGLSQDRRWSARLGLEVAGLKGSKELAFRDVQQYRQENLVPDPPLEVFQASVDDDADDFVTHVEADAAVEYRFAERFRVGLGYRQGTYFSALTEERYPSGTNLSQLQSESLDLDAGGPYLRVGVFF